MVREEAKYYRIIVTSDREKPKQIFIENNHNSHQWVLALLKNINGINLSTGLNRSSIMYSTQEPVTNYYWSAYESKKNTGKDMVDIWRGSPGWLSFDLSIGHSNWSGAQLFITDIIKKFLPGIEYLKNIITSDLSDS